MTTGVETLEFQAEAKQLLRLLVHSVYSNKEIFLRELISNASDALDLLRLEAYRDKDLPVDTSDLHIDIEADTERRTLVVRDNGIGMSREDVVELIGTLARSGTAELLQAFAPPGEVASPQLIGQFGVGFYSCFMVADRVTLLTRHAGEHSSTRWESAGDGTYTIETVDDAIQGTEVTLYLKPADADDHLADYTDHETIKDIIKRYSDFIAWPIRMEIEVRGGDEIDDEDDQLRPTRVIETLNSMKALWSRSRDEITEAEYNEFYKHLGQDWNDPLEVIHTRVEGTFAYDALLFIPTYTPFDLYMREGRRGLQLYVRRVFVMDDCEELIPDYLRFVRGVVDAHDLTLNVSREMLQHDRHIQTVRRRLTRKVLSAIKDMMSENADRYHTFWAAFGRVLKEGLLSDPDNRAPILDVASFATSQGPDQMTGLRQYVERMKDGQTDIYYLTGENRSMLENSPHMEAFREKGYEVLLLTDPVDAIWIDVIQDYEGRRFQSIAKGRVNLDTDDLKTFVDPDRDQRNEDFAGLLEWAQKTLSDEVKQVRLSSRLTASAACIVGDESDISPSLEKMYRAMGQEVPHIKRILEINPKHPLVEAIRDAVVDRGEDPGLADVAELLYGMALLAEGGELSDPARFTRLMADRLARAV